MERQVAAGSGGIVGDLGFTLSVTGVGSAQQRYQAVGGIQETGSGKAREPSHLGPVE